MPRPRTSGELPRYIDRPGDNVFEPPYQMQGSDLTILVVEADEAALNSHIDAELNAAWRVFQTRGIRHRFRAEGSEVGLAFARTPRLTSLQRSGRSGRIITAEQMELAVMIPIVDTGGETSHWAHHAWYLPFVLTNLPISVATGREVYGYPKQYATFTEPNAITLLDSFTDGSGLPFIVQAYDIAADSTEQDANQYKPRDVLQLTKNVRETGGQAEAQHQHKSFGPPDITLETSAHISAVVQNHEGKTTFLDKVKRDSYYLFLRQFRDPWARGRASYQGVVGARITPTAENFDTPTVDDLDVILGPSVFVPIAEALFGTNSARRRVQSIINASNVDLTVQRGTTWWEFP